MHGGRVDPTHESLAHQVGREAEVPVGVAAGGPAEVDRAGADVVADEPDGGEVREIEEGRPLVPVLGPAQPQHQRVERDDLALLDRRDLRQAVEGAEREALEHRRGRSDDGLSLRIAGDVLLLPPLLPDRRRAVQVERRGHPTPQLAQMPPRVHQREVGEGDVGADPLDLLRVPEREGVVVAGGDQHAVGRHRLEDVMRQVPGHRLVRPARGDPVADERDECHQQDRRGHGPLPRSLGPPRQRVGQEAPRRREPDPHPDPPEGEGGDVEVVALAHLVARAGDLGVL